MTYNEFVNVIRQELKELKGENTVIRVCPSRKPNQPLRDSLVMMEEDNPASPMFYLDSLYEQYIQGTSMSDLCDMIIHVNDACGRSVPFPVPDLSTWEYVKDHLTARLINSERNTDFLDEVCHISFIDLSVVFYINLPCSEGYVAATPVKADYPKLWDVSLSVIHETAFENMLRDDPAQFSSVQALLREMVHEKTSAEEQINASAYEDDCEELLFVLTNMRKQYGAVWMTDKHIRSMIAQRLGSFYVIPSSLHECMILPADAGQDAAQLKQMLMSVNRTQVSAEDFLGDNVYFCDSEDLILSMAV